MTQWIIPSLVGLAAGIAGAMGLGGGTVLLLYLTLVISVPQAQAQGINLVFFVPTALVATVANLRAGLIEPKTALIFAGIGTVGAIAGFLLSGAVETELLQKLFGGLLLCIGAKELFFSKAPRRY